MIDRALGKFFIVAVLVFGMSVTSAHAVLGLFSLENELVAPNIGGPPRLFQVDPTDGSTISSVPMSLAGEVVRGGGGLAANPVDGMLYGVISLLGQDGMELVKLDPLTGVATSIGDTGEVWTGIAFNDMGTLFGLTEDDFHPPVSNDPKTLYKIDPTTGMVGDLVAALTSTADDDDALAYNPDDGLLYHMSGGFFDPVVFESIDPALMTITDIPGIDGAAFVDKEPQAMVWDPVSMTFLVKNDFFGSGDFLSVSTTGTVVPLGSVDHRSKGLAFIELPDPGPGPGGVIPEPVTAVLGLMGLAGLAYTSRRRA